MKVDQGPRPGKVVELRCTYDPATRGGNAPDGRKVKGTIHWVSAAHAVAGRGAACTITSSASPIPTTCRKARTELDNLNPKSLEVLPHCWVEPSLKGAPPAAGSSSSGWATSASIRTRKRATGFQPHGDPARHLGQDRREEMTKDGPGKFGNTAQAVVL